MINIAVKKIYNLIIFIVVIILLTSSAIHAEEKQKKFERQVQSWAEECRNIIAARFEQEIKSGRLTHAKVFDTFYVPIPNTYPQKYHTQYDKFTDEAFQTLLDNYLKMSRRLVFVILTDINGYCPTHNTKYTQRVTGNKLVDFKINRTKIFFSDKVGISGAKNTEPFLLQKYYRDTGEIIYDLSVPLYIRDQHWGCVRIGFN